MPADPCRKPPIGEFQDLLKQKQKLPEFMIPSAFEILPNLPLTPNGKIDRKALPALNPSLLSVRVDLQCVDARSALELQLTHIWKRVLDVPTVGVRDNFFDLARWSFVAGCPAG